MNLIPFLIGALVGGSIVAGLSCYFFACYRRRMMQLVARTTHAAHHWHTVCGELMAENARARRLVRMTALDDGDWEAETEWPEEMEVIEL